MHIARAGILGNGLGINNPKLLAPGKGPSANFNISDEQDAAHVSGRAAWRKPFTFPPMRAGSRADKGFWS